MHNGKSCAVLNTYSTRLTVLLNCVNSNDMNRINGAVFQGRKIVRLKNSFSRGLAFNLTELERLHEYLMVPPTFEGQVSSRYITSLIANTNNETKNLPEAYAEYSQQTSITGAHAAATQHGSTASVVLSDLPR